MIPFPSLTAWSLVAAAAVAAAAPPSMWWLALFPLAVAALGLLARHPAPPRPPVERVGLRVYLDIDAGSMSLEDGREPGEPWRAQAPTEAAWRARYPYATGPIGGHISGAGAPVLESTPAGWAYADQLERLERLASTSEMKAIR